MPEAVGEVAACRATAWCEYLETHADRLYSVAEKPAMASACALLARIKRGSVKDGSTVREIYRRQWTKLATPEEVRDTLKVLAEYGWVRLKEVETGGCLTETTPLHPSL